MSTGMSIDTCYAESLEPLLHASIEIARMRKQLAALTAENTLLRDSLAQAQALMPDLDAPVPALLRKQI